MAKVLELKGVDAFYGQIQALRDVSFTIQDGEMVGYIGPNGAGKSSTIKIMSGILHPDSGSCVINGLTPWKDRRAHVREIGVVFGQRSQLWWDVPVADSFELIRDIYRVDGRAFKRNLDEMVQTLGLCAARSRPRSCTTPKSCSWTSRPSGLTRFRRSRCVSLSSASTARRARRSS
jgi:ABC-type uncharacterized transport system ATPase subunit